MFSLERIAARIASLYHTAFDPATGEMLTHALSERILELCPTLFTGLEDIRPKLPSEPDVFSVKGYAGQRVSFAMQSTALVDRGFLGMIWFKMDVFYDKELLAQKADTAGIPRSQFLEELPFYPIVDYYHKRGRMKGVIDYKSAALEQKLGHGKMLCDGNGVIQSIDFPGSFCSDVENFITALLSIGVTPPGKKNVSDLEPSTSIKSWADKIVKVCEENGMSTILWSEYRPGMILFCAKRKTINSHNEINDKVREFFKELRSSSIGVQRGEKFEVVPLELVLDDDQTISTSEVKAARENIEQLESFIRAKQKERLQRLADAALAQTGARPVNI